MTESSAIVFDIEKFAVLDGPGIWTITKNLLVHVSGFSAYFSVPGVKYLAETTKQPTGGCYEFEN